jgi:hypothetical protein
MGHSRSFFETAFFGDEIEAVENHRFQQRFFLWLKRHKDAAYSASNTRACFDFRQILPCHFHVRKHDYNGIMRPGFMVPMV